MCRAHHLSEKTQRTYWHFAKHYLDWLGTQSMNTENMRRYLSLMANGSFSSKGVSRSTQACALYSIRFLYEKVARIKLGDLSEIPKANGHQRIIEVPEDGMAAKLVAAIPGPQGTALRLIYGTGGRLNDILRLRVRDLDFSKGLISIQHSKGDKSRIVPMPKSLIPELSKLVKQCEGLDRFLFGTNRAEDKPICDVTLQRAFAKAKQKLNVKRRYTIHSLRHAAAQFWERSGVQRSTIQTLLGHSNSSTTDRYLQSGCKSVVNVPTPI